uniref:Uncharacterized protein n=1 Tax=Ignisphaera aggregans TaxID=334771 RepID=A0A7C4BBS3_9CREN
MCIVNRAAPSLGLGVEGYTLAQGASLDKADPLNDDFAFCCRVVGFRSTAVHEHIKVNVDCS